MHPYDMTTHDGKRVDVLTHQALLAAENILGYELSLTQGSYNAGGVTASAGTHDGGGVVDLLPWDWQNKVRALRQVGFAAWHRPQVQGLWNEHIHAVLIGNERLSRSAKAQVIYYQRGLDGLAGMRRDTFPYHPNGVVFRWDGSTRHASANIKSNPLMRLADAAADISYVAHRAGVIGWQELHKTYLPAVEGLAGFATYWPAGAAKAVAISWRKGRFTFVSGGSKLTHPGIPGVTPHRYVVWVVLRDRKTGEVFWRVNSHYISGAWKGANSKQPRIRRPLWNRHDAVMRERVQWLLKTVGPRGVVSADFNRPIGSVTLNALRGSVQTGHGIDRLYVFGGDATDAKRWAIHSDHDAITSRVTFN